MWYLNNKAYLIFIRICEIVNTINSHFTEEKTGIKILIYFSKDTTCQHIDSGLEPRWSEYKAFQASVFPHTESPDQLNSSTLVQP